MTKKQTKRQDALLIVISSIIVVLLTLFSLADFWTNGSPLYSVLGPILNRLIRPSAPHSTAYLNSDFIVIRDSLYGYPTGEVIFYKVQNDGSVKRVYDIRHCSPDMLRPVRIGDAFYFPNNNADHYESDNYIAILKDGRVTRKKIGFPSVENIVCLNGNFFIASRWAVCKFDKDMNLIKRVNVSNIIPKGFDIEYLYEYKETLWAMVSVRNNGENFSLLFAKLDPSNLKAVKVMKFPYFLSSITQFNGKTYALGTDFAVKSTGTQTGHDAIYEFAPTPKLVYVSPYKTLHTDEPGRIDPYTFSVFRTSQIIPVDPSKKEFALIGRSEFIISETGKLKKLLPWPHGKDYLYFTSTKKFFALPEEFRDENDDFSSDHGIYCKGYIYIGRRNYLLEFKDGKFTIADRYVSGNNYNIPFICASGN